MRTPHDIKVRRAGHTITIWCKTHQAVLFVYQGRGDVPLADVLEAVADHRGTTDTLGAATLTKNGDGTYRLQMDDVDLSAAVVNDSDFVVRHHADDSKTITMTVRVDSITIPKGTAEMVRGQGMDGEGTYEYRTHPAPGQRARLRPHGVGW